jgi:hypothetical protein
VSGHRDWWPKGCPGDHIYNAMHDQLAPDRVHDEEDEMAKIAWAGGHAYHKSGVHAVHVLGAALQALRAQGLPEEHWDDEEAFLDAHLVSAGDRGPDPSPTPDRF